MNNLSRACCMFIQSQLLQNGRNPAPCVEDPTDPKQGTQQLLGAAAPAPRGSTHLDFSHSCSAVSRQTSCPSHRLQYIWQADSPMGLYLTQNALKHPERNLVTLNVSWIATTGMSFLRFLVLTALGQKAKQRSINFWPNLWAWDLCCLFQWKAWNEAHGNIWGLSEGLGWFFSRERIYFWKIILNPYT